jgi:hypothetical protein
MRPDRQPPTIRCPRAWRSAVAVGIALAALGGGRPASAVLLYESAQRNTTAPRNSLANSGWQWEGLWNGYLGTALGKRYFVSANHIGGEPGEVFKYDDKDYRAINEWTDPDSDLRIYEIAGALPDWAPIQTHADEVGQAAVFFGRGTQRGAPVIADGTLRGWEWGTLDGVQSWGRATIAGVANGTDANGKSIGSLLEFPFKAPGHGGIDYEGAVSRGDSGGGVFVDDDGRWTLAGIVYATDGPYSLTENGPTFDASIFDARGLWENGQQIPDTANPVPTYSYATRISSHVSWIDSVLDGKLPPTESAQPSVVSQAVGPTPDDLRTMMTPLPEPQLAALAAALLLGSRARPARSK